MKEEAKKKTDKKAVDKKNETEDFEELLEHLRTARAFDFTGYKRSSLERRIRKRMAEVGIESFSGYQDLLTVHSDEFPALFDTILINVTSFFRDPESWKALAEEVLPAILEAKDAAEPVRAWVAGCASGEEAYTLAILLAEAMGEQEFIRRAKIYASDVDDGALSQARVAGYSPRSVEDIPEEYRERYFETHGSRYIFRPELRRSVIFGAMDLVQDAPISRVDLVTCRNTLMYFNTELQNRILARFHYALNDPGFLFLGKAEMMLAYGNLFTPLDLKRRIFRKVPKAALEERPYIFGRTVVTEPQERIGEYVSLREGAFQVETYAQIILDDRERAILINERARSMFDLSLKDVGRPFQDLTLSYRPVDLRSVIDEVRSTGDKQILSDVRRTTEQGEEQYLEIIVSLIKNDGGEVKGTNLTFLDVTENHLLREDLKRSKQELETAYEELQATNEELETTNEELQSTIEELETTNEELQSSNEELQTLNEELQSSNEELHTINDELKDRGDSLAETNAFLNSLLGSLRVGVAIIDRDLNLTAWNARAEDLWGVRSHEVLGRSLLSLDIGLPMDGFRDRLESCLGGRADYENFTVEARNRRGQTIDCRVSCMPFVQDGNPTGAILLMEEVRP